MRIYWEEPWSVKLVKERHKSNRRVLAGMVICALIVLAFLVAARCLVCGTDDMLPLVADISIYLLILLALYAMCCLHPQTVRFVKKGIVIDKFPVLLYENLTSISFEDRDGFHLLVVRWKNRKGKEIERTAVTSPKVPDEDVFRFLADIGQAHLCHSA